MVSIVISRPSFNFNLHFKLKHVTSDIESDIALTQIALD
jgi:hypothetical protein